MAGLLGQLGGAEAAPAPTVAPAGLEGLLGGLGGAATEAQAPAFETPAFMAQPTTQAADPSLEGLLGGAAGAGADAGGGEAALLQKLLGASLLQLDDHIVLDTDEN